MDPALTTRLTGCPLLLDPTLQEDAEYDGHGKAHLALSKSLCRGPSVALTGSGAAAGDLRGSAAIWRGLAGAGAGARTRAQVCIRLAGAQVCIRFAGADAQVCIRFAGAQVCIRFAGADAQVCI